VLLISKVHFIPGGELCTLNIVLYLFQFSGREGERETEEAKEEAEEAA
jgi:hypothetical protein